jgi:hypothetical protein
MKQKKWSDPKDPEHHRAKHHEHCFSLREDDWETVAGKARVWDFPDCAASLVLGVWGDGELTAYIEDVEEGDE